MKQSIQQLLDDIKSEIINTRNITGISKFNDRVMDAMSKVPRDKFVPSDLKSYAFDNSPLPIGYSQTISQPYVVALMTELLEVEEPHNVMEIGTGSGYQTAVLAQLCECVYTVERIKELHHQAVSRFKELKYNNVQCRLGNGCYGWEENAPYDRIIVTAAAEFIPQALINQLKVGGKLVIPVGVRGFHQELIVASKNSNGSLDTRSILDVIFVPLVDEELNSQKKLQVENSSMMH